MPKKGREEVATCDTPSRCVPRSLAGATAAPAAEKQAELLAAMSALAEEEGLTHLRMVEGRVCAIKGYLFTTALMVGLAPKRYERQYCYEHAADAAAALAAWTTGEHPPGPWIKCKGEGVDLLNPAFGKEG